MKLLTNIKIKLLLGLFLGLALPFYARFEGDPIKGDSASKAKTLANVKTTEQHVSHYKFLSKARLAEIVDSLLSLDSIDVKEIELISKYGAILNPCTDEEAVHSLSEEVPGGEYYDEFDYETIFNVTPEDSFPDTQWLVIQGDSFGSYFHPRRDKINSQYGWRDKRMHRGMDIDLNKGDQIMAAFDGMVRIAKRHPAFGNVVIIRHFNGLETVYGHMSKLKVKPGQRVVSGQLIGLGGSTGRSTGPHLHFEVRFKGHSLNPANFIDFAEFRVKSDTLVIKRTKAGIVAYPHNAKFHTVCKGDSWFEVAKQYGLSVKELLALNGTAKRYYLRVGQKVRIN